jgi:hypothetical protein
VKPVRQRFLQLENQIHHQLVLHSISALRVAIGAVFLGFGVLKYFPGFSPAKNLTEATFSGPHNAPTLEGQYVLKDIILVTAALVIVAGSFRGGQLVRADPPPGRPYRQAPVLPPSEQPERDAQYVTAQPGAMNGSGGPRQIASRPGLGKA